jgi:hypothetical protein
MTAEQENEPPGDELSDEDLELVYGSQPGTEDEIDAATNRRKAFKPWHHPVKQIVRRRQWVEQTLRLIRNRGDESQTLRYFTLPGVDLLDVRVLAEFCNPLGVKIDYFGFNNGQDAAVGGDGTQRAGESFNAESTLRQAGRISETALILPDRLEDLAIDSSQAAAQLRQRSTFDVINIDACAHLAFQPAGRTHTTFDALRALLRHQMTSRTQWLLFITTRARPDLLGTPGDQFRSAITANLEMHSDFAEALATSLNADPANLATSLASAWGNHDTNFLKLYCIGLGKFLLQFFHMQPNLPANVELASCYSYRVYNGEPDMLAVAFRITPDPPRVFDPGTGGTAFVEDLEPARAIRVATRAQNLWDLDAALSDEDDVRVEAVNGTVALLSAANYNLEAWRDWLESHPQRPMSVEL